MPGAYRGKRKPFIQFVYRIHYIFEFSMSYYVRELKMKTVRNKLFEYFKENIVHNIIYRDF